MAEDVPVSEEYFEDEEPVCQDGDWNCMLENYYPGYLILVEAVVKAGEDEEGNPVYRVNSIDVTGFTNEEINETIDDMKVVYPDAVEYRVHFCGNHVGKPCKMVRV